MSTEPIAAQLEKNRLELRARRIELVIYALRDRAVYRHGTSGAAPAALQRAIADFGSQLGATRRRLAELSPDGCGIGSDSALRSS